MDGNHFKYSFPRRRVISLNIPSRPFLLTDSNTPIIPSLTEIILDSFGRFDRNFAQHTQQTPVPLPPHLATKLIHTISNNPLKGVTVESLCILVKSLKNLKNINTDSCIAFNDNVLVSLLSVHPPLEVISINNCPHVTDYSISMLENVHSLKCFKANNTKLTVQGLSHLHNLYEFECIGCNTIDDACLMKLASRNPGLTHVSFGNARLSDGTISRFIQQLNGDLVHLNISNSTQVNSLTISQLFHSQLKLKYLNMSNCFQANGDHILDSYLPMFRPTLFRWLEGVEYLNISGCVQFSDAFISQLLINAPMIHTLVLDDTNVTDSSIQDFIRSSIAYGETIRRSFHTSGMRLSPLSVSLKRCLRITELAYTELFQKRGCDITSINMCFSPTLSPLSLNVFSVYTTSLTSFYCSNNDLLSESTWLKFITQCPHIKILFISNNRGVSYEVIKRISECCPSISHLDISSCMSLVPQSSNMISQIHSLEYLDISFDTMFGENEVKEIINALPRLSNFSMQGICYNEVYMFTQQAQWLNSLKLNFIPSCNDDVLRNISSYCPLLTSLELRMCSGITDTGIELLLQKCNKLIYIVLGGTSVTPKKMQDLLGRGLFIN
ncbi:Leucine-rich repeat containing protein [Entamoeba marina]